jgi:hypothetical protein
MPEWAPVRYAFPCYPGMTPEQPVPTPTSPYHPRSPVFMRAPGNDASPGSQQRTKRSKLQSKKRKASNDPGEQDGVRYKSHGWTPAQKAQIYEWKHKKHSYEKIAIMFEDKWPEGKVKSAQLRMVVHRHRKDLRNRARTLGEPFPEDKDSDDHDAENELDRDSDSRANVDVKWTPAEISLLLECRALTPPMTYGDIAEKIQSELRCIRTEKACREQMHVQVLKKQGLTVQQYRSQQLRRKLGQDPSADMPITDKIPSQGDSSSRY